MLRQHAAVQCVGATCDLGALRLYEKNALPIGLQIAGPHWREDLVLRLAHAYEQATEWHTRQPVETTMSRGYRVRAIQAVDFCVKINFRRNSRIVDSWLPGADIRIKIFVSISLKALPSAGFAKPYRAKYGFQRT